ncbi:MAG: GMC family oxidoreductase [Rhodobacteraceae bacterium]|nr:GMC family oxidoreductase [Paracoccaceae bacterium]
MSFDPHHIPDAFDIIIVGSGSGGSVVARRLVDAGHDVLVLEAGGDGRGDPLLEDPTRWMQVGASRHDWGHHYAAHPATLNRAIPIPRGRVLGGCGTTNAMMWYRGHPADYDRWRDLGCTGWGFAECLPAFRACEDWAGEDRGGADCALRGRGGPLKVAPPPPPPPRARAERVEGVSPCFREGDPSWPTSRTGRGTRRRKPYSGASPVGGHRRA